MGTNQGVNRDDDTDRVKWNGLQYVLEIKEYRMAEHNVISSKL